MRERVRDPKEGGEMKGVKGRREGVGDEQGGDRKGDGEQGGGLGEEEGDGAGG